MFEQIENMPLKSIVIILTIVFQFLFVPFNSNGDVFQENLLSKAIQLFDKEKYAEAEPVFKTLLDQKPDDFMVNYFYGACRTENGHYSDEDLNYLLKASKEVTPLNIDYYFAVQYHAKNQWEKALSYYKLYQKGASENEQEKTGLKLKMEQCSNKINPFVSQEAVEKHEDNTVQAVAATGVSVAAVDNVSDHVSVIPATQTVNADSSEIEPVEIPVQDSVENTAAGVMDSTIRSADNAGVALQTETVQQQEVVKDRPVESRIDFNINDEITYLFASNFKTDEGKIYFEQGVSKEAELQKVLKETEDLRGKYKTSSSRAEKDSTGQLILALENQAYELKNVVTQMYLLSKNAENAYWQNAQPSEKESFIKELNTSAAEMNSKNEVNPESVSENPGLIIPPVLIENDEEKADAPKPKTTGVTYKIQIGAFSRGIPANQKAAFSKISVIRKVEKYTDENGVVVYTTGNLTSYEDAVVMQGQVKKEGIKDPKIAAYFNGKRITLEKAKELESNK